MSRTGPYNEHCVELFLTVCTMMESKQLRYVIICTYKLKVKTESFKGLTASLMEYICVGYKSIDSCFVLHLNSFRVWTLSSTYISHALPWIHIQENNRNDLNPIFFNKKIKNIQAF